MDWLSSLLLDFGPGFSLKAGELLGQLWEDSSRRYPKLIIYLSSQFVENVRGQYILLLVVHVDSRFAKCISCPHPNLSGLESMYLEMNMVCLDA